MNSKLLLVRVKIQRRWYFLLGVSTITWLHSKHNIDWPFSYTSHAPSPGLNSRNLSGKEGSTLEKFIMEYLQYDYKQSTRATPNPVPLAQLLLHKRQHAKKLFKMLPQHAHLPPKSTRITCLNNLLFQTPLPIAKCLSPKAPTTHP